MGKHYVPQHYLRNFGDVRRPGFIWMFDKKSGQSCQASISKVAQEPLFYEPDVEVRLSQMIESPANPVIDLLRRKRSPTERQRSDLAVYIAVMLKRVPYRRQRAMAMIPRVLDETISRIRNAIAAPNDTPDADQAVVQQRLTELDRLYEAYKAELPAEVVRRIEAPWPSTEIVQAIDQMTWRVLETTGSDCFMTSDNPAFFFGAYGLTNSESEICFPISTQIALHCCWQPSPTRTAFLPASQSLVKEFNRRLASTTARFAFYHETTPWILKLLEKTQPYLSRIIW